MIEGGWDLDGLDADMRLRALAEAEECGLTLSEYLAFLLLALADDENPAPSSAGATGFDPSSAPPELDAGLRSLRRRIADIEDVAAARNDRHEQAQVALAETCAELARRSDDAAALARRASDAATQGAAAQDLLRQTLADEFSEFARRAASRIDAALADVRATADDAAKQAETAASALVDEMRTARASIDARLSESAAETRKRMQLAFAETQARVGALADRVSDSDRATRAAVDGLHQLVAESDEKTRAALAATAAALRKAHAALGAESARAADDHRQMIAALRADLSADVQILREGHAAVLARQDAADALLSEACAGLAALRHAASDREAAVAALRNETQQALRADIAEIAEAIAADREQTAEGIRAAHAEAERVEACTLVSLSKLAGDIAAIRTEHNQTLAQISARAMAERNVEQRLTQLEDASASIMSAQGSEAIKQQLAELRSALLRRDSDGTLARRLDELAHRLSAHEALSSEAIERLDGMVGALDGLGAPSSEAELKTDERLRTVEAAVSEVARRLDTRSENPPSQDAVMAVEIRMAEIEMAQAAALDGIRAQLTAFIDANNRRLEALELAPALINIGDIASDFEALRAHIDERMAYIENRSVRALQQAADTMGVLEERFGRGDRRSA
ncbi:MAG: hypothetical protein K2P58_05295 [Hyphomonadaceae bacterium]|nr:hypothetical protein [Hyphomonadaceae bacterium]